MQSTVAVIPSITMQSVDTQNHENSTQSSDDPCGTAESKNPDWLARLQDCSQKIENLRLMYNNIITTQGRKWNDYVARPLKQRETRSENLRPRVQNMCSSTPIAPRTDPPMGPRSKSLAPSDTKLPRAPMKAVILFDEGYSDDVDPLNNFQWVTTGDGEEPDDDYEGQPIGTLKSSTLKAALADHKLPEPGDDPYLINASWNPETIDQARDGGRDSGLLQLHEFNRDLDWVSRLQTCLQRIDNLSSRYQAIMSCQARKWDEFVANTFVRTHQAGGFLSNRPQNLGSSTPKPMGQITPLITKLSTIGSKETKQARVTPRLILFGDNSVRNACPKFDFELETKESDDESDDDFRGEAIERLSRNTFENALVKSEVSKKLLVSLY